MEAELDTVAGRYEEVAAELSRAADHARTSARHLRDRELARGPAHAFSVVGHLVRAQRILDELAALHAERSAPLDEWS